MNLLVLRLDTMNVTNMFSIKSFLGGRLFILKLCCLIACVYSYVKIVEYNTNSIKKLNRQIIVNTSTWSQQCQCEKSLFHLIDSELQTLPIEEPATFEWCSVESSRRGKHQRVIAFSLFGEIHNEDFFQRYYSLLRHIAIISEKEYPGWIVRIYHDIQINTDDSVSNKSSNETLSAAGDVLCDVFCEFSNVDLCNINWLLEQLIRVKHRKLDELKMSRATAEIDSETIQGVNPRMYRFLAMVDPNVDVFVMRDADSIILHREVVAVKQWLSSNFTFHVMRDHQLHYAVMLAGMWGAKLNKKRELLEGLAVAIFQSGQNKTNAYQDQNSLAEILWPIAKHDVMVHDSYHCENVNVTRGSRLKTLPFPTRRQKLFFVGEVVKSDLIVPPQKCPKKCRPVTHQEWEYC